MTIYHVLTERIDICPACKAHETIFWCEAHDRLYRTTEQKFEYRNCKACKTIFQSVRPVESEVWKCYPDTYGPHSNSMYSRPAIKLPMFLDRLCMKLADLLLGRPEFMVWMRAIERRLVDAKDILDFGCGSGKYLDRARKLGCKTLGIDFSLKALGEAARRGHEVLPVSEKTWNMLSIRKLKFVRMNHVFEHLYNPQHVLQQIQNAMDVGGCLYLSTPNPLGPSAILYREAWFSLECPRHIALVPPKQLEIMLKEAGFRSISIVQEPTAKDLLRSWAYKKVDAGKFIDVDVGGLASDGLLSFLFALPMRIKTHRTGHSDRFHAIAFK